MSLIIAVLAVCLLSLPALVATGALAPAARVRIACGAAVSGMSLLGVAMLIAASPLLLRLHHELESTRGALSHLSPGGPWVWVAGAVFAVAGASWVMKAVRRAITARRRAALPRFASVSTAYDEYAGAEVRIAPSVVPLAFAVPGRDRHVVISQAVAQLPEPERRAVVAHEGAHLRLRHDRHLLAFSVYEHLWGWLPGVRGVITKHRHFIEQWADLDASRNPLIDQQAFRRARSALGGCAHTTSRATLSAPATSSRRHLVGVVGLAAALIVAGVYSTAHSVSDLTTAIAAAH